MPRDYRQLKVFRSADNLVLRIYEVTRNFPKDEMFGLVSQMRRAIVSVPANIVEGASRDGEREFLYFLNVAYGSLAEVGYHIDLSLRLGYISQAKRDELHACYDETSRMLNGLIRSIK